MIHRKDRIVGALMGQDGEDAQMTSDETPHADAPLPRSPRGASSRLRASRTARTARPVDPLPSEEEPSALKEAMNGKLEQFQLIQDFLHNPIPFDLKELPLESGSTAEEIAARRTELEYQRKVLQSILKVLDDELEQLAAYAPAAPR